MKNAVVSLVIGDDWKKVADVSFPTFKAYASRVGADFISISESLFCPAMPGWEKLQLGKILDTHERVVFIDADAIVRSDTPNLFNLVPVGSVGGFRPTSAWWGANGKYFYEHHSKQFGVPTPANDGSYINTGVMVLDQTHRPILVAPPCFPNSGNYEEPWINIQIQTQRIPVTELSWHYNNTGFTRWGYRPKRAYIMHFNKMGRGLHTFDLSDVMKEALFVWEALGY